jgi:beta-glucosidase
LSQCNEPNYSIERIITKMQKEKIIIAQKNLVPVSRQAACEGIVLLENKDAVLPIRNGEVVSLFGRCQIDTYRSGTGSGGAVNVPYAVNALEGLRANTSIRLNEELVTVYQNWLKDNPFEDGGGAWAAEPWFQHEMPVDDDLVQQAALKSDKAIVFIGRTAGEDQDNEDEPGSYRLTDLEVTMVEKVTAHFDRVIVVFNTTNIMDMSWLETTANKHAIKAVLYSWAAGMEGGHALADILSGDVSPSGRLTDTIAYQLADYPSSANFGRRDYNQYAEDIYVGYRYFETFKPQAVQYEFGAGLSYTEFRQKVEGFIVEGEGNDSQLHFDVTVHNIGEAFACKEVVQLYCEAPQGELGKPARVLVGFAKTELIEPGEKETIRISVPLKSLASYDDSGVTGHRNCYLLEAGCYQFYVGSSVRKTQRVPSQLTLESLLVTEKLSEAAAPIQAFDRLMPGERNDDGTYQETYQAVPLRSINLKERMDQDAPITYQITGDQGIKLIDVKEGRASMGSFIAQLSEDDLATIVRGEGMCSPKVTPGTAAAFGGVSDRLFNFGIPVVAAADGPSGIRMDSGHKATQVPIGTLLGCTWNQPLNEALFFAVGQEMFANQIDTLLGPGINIHRHPLNGRNFEYFSEDPFMTGSMGAAQTRGLSRAGVSGTLKHYACNDQETARSDADSVMSQRALREVHIRAFEMAVKEGNASTIMTAYNPVNGHWTASNYDLNTTILRGEWGYTGIVMTDWWAKMNHPIDAGKEARTFTSYMVRSQNDLYMVVENDGAQVNAMGDDTKAALENGSLTVGELQRCAMNICRFIMAAPVMDRPLVAFDPVKSYAALNAYSDIEAPSLDYPLQLDITGSTAVHFYAPQDGVYQCSAIANYYRDALSQSSCSLSFNGDFAMSLPVNGTEGKSTTVEGLQVKLEQGIYRLDIDFVKAGMTLEQVIFTKQ